MSNFAFRKNESLFLLGVCLIAVAGILLTSSSHDRMRLLGVFASVGIAILNYFVSGYYAGKRAARETEYRLRIEAQPLVELKAQMINELKLGQGELLRLETDVGRLRAEAEVLTSLSSLDERTLRQILLRMPRGSNREVWVERLFGFGIGILASLVASVIYESFKLQAG